MEEEQVSQRRTVLVAIAAAVIVAAVLWFVIFSSSSTEEEVVPELVETPLTELSAKVPNKEQKVNNVDATSPNPLLTQDELTAPTNVAGLQTTPVPTDIATTAPTGSSGIIMALSLFSIIAGFLILKQIITTAYSE